jgi:hypothetical protein
MEIPVNNLIDIAEHLKRESRKYKHGLVERIHREGDIEFRIHEYKAPAVSREVPNKVALRSHKVGRVILKGDVPVFVMD